MVSEQSISIESLFPLLLLTMFAQTQKLPEIEQP